MKESTKQNDTVLKTLGTFAVSLRNHRPKRSEERFYPLYSPLFHAALGLLNSPTLRALLSGTLPPNFAVSK